MTKRSNFDFTQRDRIEIIYEIIKAIVENGPQSMGRLQGYVYARYHYFIQYIKHCLDADLLIQRNIGKRKQKFEYEVTEKGLRYYSIIKKNPNVFKLERRSSPK
jgi:predicted transcriptional regulator